MYIEQEFIVFIFSYLYGKQTGRSRRGRLIVLLQSRRRPFIVISMSLQPTSMAGPVRHATPSDFGVVFRQRRLIIHTALCSWGSLPLNSFVLRSLHRHFNESTVVSIYAGYRRRHPNA